MIITNREEVIDKAFGVFVRMNYEKASIITLAKACGGTKTGIVYYFPHKLDLFSQLYSSKTARRPFCPI